MSEDNVNRSEAECLILAAQIQLSHMLIYSYNLLSIVSFGLHHALRDHNYFTEPLKEIAPHLAGAQLENVARMSREMTMDESIKGARAACLIFLHAGCESALSSVAKATALEPHRWNELINKKQVSIGDLIATDVETVLKNKIQEQLIEFDRDNLIRKTRTLFRLLQPPRNSSDGYTFSEERLTRIDLLRHKCAHGGCDIADFSTFEDDVEYLRQTAEFFVNSAAEVFKVALPRFQNMKLNHFKGVQEQIPACDEE